MTKHIGQPAPPVDVDDMIYGDAQTTASDR